MSTYIMQARSSTTGAIVTWSAPSPDWIGALFPGPGAAQDVAVAGDNVEGGGGGATPGGSVGQNQINNGSGGFGATPHGVVGNVLIQTGATANGFGALDLANANATTGALAGSKVAANFVAQNVVTTGSYAAGSAPATDGQLRTTGALSQSHWQFRHHVDGGNYSLVRQHGGGGFHWGSPTFMSQFDASSLVLNASLGSMQAFGVGSLGWTLTGTAMMFAKPIGGDSSSSAPYRRTRATITFASANYTLSAAEYSSPRLRLTGATGGARDLILPNVADAEFEVKNDTANIITAKISGGTGVPISAGAIKQIRHNGTDYEDWSSHTPDFGAQDVTTTGVVKIGANPASAGAGLRMAAGTILTVRNAVGTADLPVLAVAVTAAAAIDIGSTSVNQGDVNIRTNNGGSVVIESAGVTRAVFANANVHLPLPVAGYAAASAPCRRARATITQSTTADTTLTAAQFACPKLVATGTPGGAFNWVGPNLADAVFEIKNGTPSPLTFKVAGQVGVTIATGKTASVYHNGTDYERCTLDA